MPGEKVGIKTGITAKLVSKDDSGKVKKTTFFYPDLDVSVEAIDEKEARPLAEAKSAKIKKQK